MANEVEIRITSKADTGQVDKAAKALKDLKGAAGTVDSKVNVDDSELKQADRLVDDLDGKKANVKVDADASPLAGSVESALGNIDASSAGQTVVGQLTGALGKAGPWAAAGAAAVGLFAGEFVVGFDAGFNQRKNQLTLAIKTGLPPSELRPIGEAAGKAWDAGFGDSMMDLQVTAATLDSTLSELDPSLSLEKASIHAEILEEHFGVGIPRSAEIAGRMISQGLADNTTEAFDVMIGSGQKFMASFDEVHDVVREFGTTFGELKISGAAAADFVGTAWQRGLIPTIDRAGELFEEFVIEVSAGVTGRAAPAIAELGLSFDDLQSKLASGRGKQALLEVVDALLQMEDTAYRNELAIEIFGTSIESATDKRAVLELIAEIDNLGTAFEGAAAEAESFAQATDWEILKRDATDLATTIGQQLAGEYKEAKDHWVEMSGVFRDNTVEVNNLGGALEEMGGHASGGRMFFDEMAEAAEDAGANVNTFVGISQDFADKMIEAAEATGTATDEIRGLDDAVAQLTGQYDASRILRTIEADAQALIEKARELTGDVFDVGTGFDRATAQSRELEAGLEDQAENVIRLAGEYREGNATAGELQGAMGSLSGSVNDVAREMGLSQAEAAELRARFVDLVGEYVADVIVNTSGEDALDRVAYKIGNINSKTVTVTTRAFTRGVATGGGVGAAQAGGGHSGLRLVGEEGPELANFGTGGWVMPASNTRQMMGAGAAGGGGGGITVHLEVHGSVVTERDIVGIVAEAFRNGGIAGVEPAL